MSQDTILKDDDGNAWSFDNIKTQGWLDGRAACLDTVDSWLKNRAVELFKAGKDSEAVAMRTLAYDIVKALEPELRQAARNHERDFPAQISKDKTP